MFGGSEAVRAHIVEGTLIADLAHEASLPADVVQVIQGDGTIGAALVRSGVDVI
jgi:acyl-CoA reductase-like NAD-dependent aldehyde dehydrogenase